MRILTVRQPWAWAIIHGGKDIENRVANIAGDYRGPVAIHAGLRFDYDWQSAALDDAMRPVRNDAARRAVAEYGPIVRHPWPWEEPLGAIIGVVDLVDVHAGWVEGSLCTPWGIRYVEGGGQNHLVLANPRPLAEPISYKGALGLRVLDDETTARVLEAIA